MCLFGMRRVGGVALSVYTAGGDGGGGVGYQFVLHSGIAE